MVAITTENPDAALIQFYMPKILAAHKDGATLDNPRPIVCLFDHSRAVKYPGVRRWLNRNPVKIEQAHRKFVRTDRLFGFGAMTEADLATAFPDEGYLLKKFAQRGEGELFVVLLLEAGVTGAILREIA